MAEDFRPHLVLHRAVGLGSNAIPELRLDHVEGGLDVAALVIPREEFVAVELVEVEHLCPQAALVGDGVGLERDVRPRPHVEDRFVVRLGRDLRHVELGGGRQS